MLERLAEEIPLLKKSTGIVRIVKGFSQDEKFMVSLKDKSKLLLKLFDLSGLPSKRQEFTILEKMHGYTVPCSQPIEIGEAGGKGYMITSFIEGKDAEEEIKHLSEQDQYAIGLEAGRQLRKMHQLHAPEGTPSWYKRKAEKHRKYVEAYSSCGVKIKHDDRIIDFIEENLHMLKNRPSSFQHDDYHPGNLIIQNKSLAGIIDFNRFDWGDPIHEFLKIGIFSRNISIPFSIGQIKGYHDQEEPGEAFWTLYSVYLGMCAFSTVIWTLKHTPENLEGMMEKVYLFLEDHDYFSKMRPKWYDLHQGGQRQWK
ncbi:aminoglycoside phosphotransferase family protein [Bacillus infantis]|uniref:Aminoglycoside phosphotransferase family protein n=1 Tax=Bacillus infantis TaxID=324767 RepID=A0A5D4SQ66_9BACI|nr:aminoglycoside phosphotransferase family protein [Bacillus infantis]TYS65440.1 aminoglycoside phosphotransferase family protein [Bacillus infantis]